MMGKQGPHEAITTVLLDYEKDNHHYNDEIDDATIVRSTRIIWLVFLVILSLVVWSYFAEIVEVSSGAGKVVPSSSEQVIQSFEGGILSAMEVREGDIVESGQILAKLNPIINDAKLDESESRYRAAQTKAIRLQAEVNGSPLEFPKELENFPDLVALQTRLYEARRGALEESLAGIRETRAVVQQELGITRSLAQAGAASNVEVLRLQRQVSELNLQETDKLSTYMVSAREDLAKATADMEALEAEIRGLSESVRRTTLQSPVRGIVKNIEITTLGGVIPPNGELMTIVPIDDKLLVEARISPRDIAFIYPGQEAKVKISAYDSAIYGALDGEVVNISPDSIQDEADPQVFYYQVLIRTEESFLEDRSGNPLSIVPGMVATVDIRTGEKTVFTYLVKPISKAREALRER